ncbi:beta-1,3-galactosyltransferase 5-like [Vespa crabro]|uniref:beta-1,3-galactosyltransferase 5-like n=1 Tax=Vespa crabro TaxID=7445 RepID=UPI001EFF97FD|nr:beta-1,3-galactosyltransferase 5-like [Vespa crabro]
MYQFLHPRNRPLQTLILGLIVLTFYAYYRTTFYDIHQFGASARNFSHTVYQEPLRNQSNHSIDIQSVPKNMTYETLSLNSYSQHNASNTATIITTLSTSSSSQALSSVSTSLNLKQSSEVPLLETEIVVNTRKSVSVISNDYARAIYEAGHTVPIPEKCPDFGKEMDLVIIIMSAPTHVEARTAIRQTWGHFGQRRDISILFMLGATLDSKVEKVLEREQRIYGDIIRGKFLDSYSNLTLKTISILEWVDSYCSKVKFILKTDDDMFINVPRLLAFINKHAKDRSVIFGRLARKWKPIRNKKSKYYVSQMQFKQPVFPDFTTGPAYLLSSDIVRKLYDAALDQTYLKLEDVFMTGIVAHKLGIKRVQANEFLNKRIPYNLCNIQHGISIHMVKYSEQFDLWKKLLDGKSKCK